ncbi:peptidylprolyl isomerase [bacterium]|nr:peptidylprolyl isomerase [bacterium]
MKRTCISIVMLALLVSGCGSGSKKLEPGTKAYDLAATFSELLPELAPEKNKVLISSTFFTIRTADIVRSIVQSPGTDLSQFDNLDEYQLRNALTNIVDNLAKRRLILRAAVAAGYTCNKEELDALYQTFVDRFSGEENFKKELERIEIGIDDFRSGLEEGIIRQKYIDNIILNHSTVTDDDLKRAYNSIKANETATVRHVLLLTEGKSVAEKESLLQKMKGIHRRAVRGEDFAALARAYTEDPSTKENGGLYENFSRGDMVQPFDERAFTIPVGQVSDIFETRFGYHILKVIDRRGDPRSFDEMRDDLETSVKQYKENQALDLELAHLKIDADMKTMSF